MSKFRRLTVLAHGATTSSRSPGFADDEPLLDGEAAKARAVALHVAKTVAVVSAPELRARQTAEALDKGHVIDPALRDLSFGRWSGRTLAEIGASEPDGLGAWISDADAAPHGGESVSVFLRRIAVWMNDSLEGEGHHLIVTHPAVIRAMVVAVLASPPEAYRLVDVGFLGMADFRSDGRRWALRGLGRMFDG